jgi:adenine specific DNA methylase Mod
VGRGLDSYLQWFYETATILHDLLAENGSIYVHLDYHVSHYAKAILDEVFGSEHFQNEIIWKRQSAHSAANRFGPIHDTILFASKTDDFTWNQQFEPLS